MIGKEVLQRVKRLGLPLGQYVVVGGGVMAIHGLRETDDIDIVVLPKLFKKISADNNWLNDPTFEKKWGQKRLLREEIEIHEKMMFLNKEGGVISAQSVIETANVISGVPFQSLRSLLRFKQNALREKDKLDVKTLEKILKERATE